MGPSPNLVGYVPFGPLRSAPVLFTDKATYLFIQLLKYFDIKIFILPNNYFCTLMNRTIPNILFNCKRYFLVFAAMFLVLLTSCAVKTSIKNLAGIPTKTEQGVPKGSHNFSTNTIEKCAQFDALDTQIVQKNSSTANDVLPTVIFTASFPFLFGFRPVSKESKHPLYSGSGKIRSSIPIFLEYRKLIIHYAC